MADLDWVFTCIGTGLAIGVCVGEPGFVLVIYGVMP